MPRPTSPLLSRPRICQVALVLIDELGLEEFSMRRLAAKLNVQAASIYGHYANKDDVLDAVANALIRDVDTSAFGQGWRPGLLTWGCSYKAILEAHPHAAPIIAAGAGERFEFLAMANGVHGGLVGDGWPPRYATMIAASVKYLVVGSAMTPFSSGFSDDASIYLDRYPHLHQAHRLRQQAKRIDSDSFELALESLIAGLAPVYESVRSDLDAEAMRMGKS